MRGTWIVSLVNNNISYGYFFNAILGTDVNSTFVDDDQSNCYTEVEELTLGDGSTVYRIDRGAKEIGSYQERLTIGIIRFELKIFILF